ncbi:MAG: hypothetical protein PHC39_08995 [Proteiniphilum sp.]|nr:hypothetical protein [Proteiniphilum sp.]
MGSYFILHELFSSLRLLLDTTIPYEKRYHIQSINLSLCEAYNYFSGKENNGIWSLLKPMIVILDDPKLNPIIEIVDRELAKLRIEFCDKQMRNSTAHFDQPIERYKSICSITEEDKYCRGISQFLLIHSYFSSISTMVFVIINQTIPKKTIQDLNEEIPKISAFDIKDFVEKSVAEKLASDERMNKVSGQSLTVVSNSIDSLYNNHLRCEELEEFSVIQNKELSISARTLNQLILSQIMVAFIRCDLTCAIRAYMNSESSMERSLHLRKVYLIEVSALTHLYGYNSKKNTKSVWSQLIALGNDNRDPESELIQEKLEEQTNQLDSVRRNLHTHFREGDELNIVKRHEAYKKLNQVSELKRSLDLVHLCEKIEDYIMSVMSRIDKKQRQKSIEQQDYMHTMFESMRTIIKNSKSSEEIKTSTIAKLNEMEKKLTHLFDLNKPC